MNEGTKVLEQPETKEAKEEQNQAAEVSPEPETSDEEGQAPEGTENEGSEAQGDGGKQEAAKPDNKTAAKQRISNRIRKLTGETETVSADNRELAKQLAIANQKNDILNLAINQQGKPPNKVPAVPSPEDFEGGVHDPVYIKQFQDHLKLENQQEIKKQVAEAAKYNQETTNAKSLQRENERKQADHYLRAIEGNSDYEKKEDVAMDILGKVAIEDIILHFDDSDKIIYQLGADEDMAYEVADARESGNHVKVVRLLERASKGLKVKPNNNNKNTPDPDLALEGGSPSESKKRRGPPGAKFW